MSNTSLSSVVSSLVRASMGTSVPSTVKDEDLDRHIAELILKEAKQKAERYGSQGIRAYLPQHDWSESSAVKPNKRFLSSIIKSTDDHNKAIQQAQAQAAEEVRRERREQERQERRARAEEAVEAERLRRLMGGGLRDIDNWGRGEKSDTKGKGRERRKDDDRDRDSDYRRDRDRRRIDYERTEKRHRHRDRHSHRSRSRSEERYSSRRSKRDRSRSPRRPSCSPGDEKRESRSHRHRSSRRHRRHRSQSLTDGPSTSRQDDSSLQEYDRESLRLRSSRSISRSKDVLDIDLPSPKPGTSRHDTPGTPTVSPEAASREQFLRDELRLKSKDSEQPSIDISESRGRTKSRSKSPIRAPTPEIGPFPALSARPSDTPPAPQPIRSPSRSLTPPPHRKRKRRRSRSGPRSPSASPPPLPPHANPPSKMDKYFSPTYDPRLDVTPLSTKINVPKTGLITDDDFAGWEAMLEVIRQRREDKEDKKRLERSGLSTKDKVGKAATSEGVDVMSIKYKKRGSVREWDLGKEGL